MTVNAIYCTSCKDTIYSRARHDYRSCSCGKIAIDGGFDYCKIIGKVTDFESKRIKIKETKFDLYKDWNEGINKYGLIKEVSNG